MHKKGSEVFLLVSQEGVAPVLFRSSKEDEFSATITPSDMDLWLLH